MTPSVGLGSAQAVAVGGIRRQIERFNNAAQTIATAGAAAHNASVVSISDTARAAALEGLGGGLEGALVESQEASSLLAANVSVLSTASDMSRELIDMMGRRK